MCRRKQWPKLRLVRGLAEDGFVFKLDFIVYVLLGGLYHIGSDMRKLHGAENDDKLRDASRLPFLHSLVPTNPDAWVHFKRDNLEAFVDRGGAVKVASFGSLDTLNRVEDQRRAAGSRVRVASLVDLAGMKMRVIQVRGSWKDYPDIHTLESHGIDVPTGLAAAKAIDRSFDPVMSIRALQFYGDGTLHRVPAAMQKDLIRWAQAVDLTKLTVLGSRHGLSPEGLER